MGNTGLADFVLIVTQRICKNLIVFRKQQNLPVDGKETKSSICQGALYTYLIAFHYWVDNGNLRRGMKGVQLFLLGYKCTVLMWLCLRYAETNSESYLMAWCASRRILTRSDTWTDRNAYLDIAHKHLHTEQWADELFVKESRFPAPRTERSGGRPLSQRPGLLESVFPFIFSTGTWKLFNKPDLRWITTLQQLIQRKKSI